MSIAVKVFYDKNNMSVYKSEYVEALLNNPNNGFITEEI